LALAALALVVFGAYDSYPKETLCISWTLFVPCAAVQSVADDVAADGGDDAVADDVAADGGDGDGDVAAEARGTAN